MCDVMISMIQFQFSNKELEFLISFIFIVFLVQNALKFMKILLKYVMYEAFYLWKFLKQILTKMALDSETTDQTSI